MKRFVSLLLVLLMAVSLLPFSVFAEEEAVEAPAEAVEQAVEEKKEEPVKEEKAEEKPADPEPETVEPEEEIVETEPAEPEAEEPEAAEPEAEEPEPAEPEAAEPEAIEPEAAEPGEEIPAEDPFEEEIKGDLGFNEQENLHTYVLEVGDTFNFSTDVGLAPNENFGSVDYDETAAWFTASFSKTDSKRIKAIAPGSGIFTINYEVYTIEGYIYPSFDVRIDVVKKQTDSPDNLLYVKLLTNSITLDCFGTDYPVVDFWAADNKTLFPELSAVRVDTEDLNIGTESGSKVKKIEFSDPDKETLGKLFRITQLSDRTFEIGPDIDNGTLDKLLNGTLKLNASYSAYLNFEFSDGRKVRSDTKLTIKTQQKMAKAAVSPVTLNCSYPVRTGHFEDDFGINGNTAAVVIKMNGKVIPDGDLLEYDYAAGSLPEWLGLIQDKGVLYAYYAADAGSTIVHQTTVSLNLRIRGYSYWIPVSLQVTAKPAAPKLAVMDKTVTVYRGPQYSMGGFNSLCEGAGYTDACIDIASVKVTEGKTAVNWGGTGSGKEVELNIYTDYDPSDGISILIDIDCPYHAGDTKDHTYKISVAPKGGKAVTFTVKSIYSEPKLKAKVSGYAEYLPNGIRGKGVDITMYFDKTLDPMQYSGSLDDGIKEADYEIKKPDGTLVNKSLNEFAVKLDWNRISIYCDPEKAAPVPGTYTLVVKAECNSVSQTAEVPFTVKCSAKAPKPFIKITGFNKKALDPLSPQAIGVKYETNIPVSGWRTAHPNVWLEIFKKAGKEWVAVSEPFEVYDRTSVRRTLGKQYDGGQYGVRLAGNDTNGQPIEPSAIVALPIKMDVLSAAPENASLVLLRNDPYDSSSTNVKCEFKGRSWDGGLRGLNKCEPVGKEWIYMSGHYTNGLYNVEIIDNGANNNWDVKFTLTPEGSKLKSGTAKTVKFQYWMDGNETAKANGTFSIKVTVK